MMERIVFFGKGGIGKSTIAANVSVLLAAGGRKVLHVGCDPKRDSTLSLMGRRIRPFNDQGYSSDEEAALRGAIHPSIKGIDCVEAGGPQAGLGCAGAGIGSMLDAIKNTGFIKKNGYDTVIFDVLGDVVCGGFAAPLRRGFADKAVLVVSEEILSLYAANNLIALIDNYARNGTFLAGLAVNAKDPSTVGPARDFARAVNTRVLGVVGRDPAVARAEKARKPVVLLEPRSEAARSLAHLAGEIVSAARPASAPRVLSEAEFDAFMNERPAAPSVKAGRAPLSAGPQTPLSPVALLEKSGFNITGLAGEQVVCSWTGGGTTLRLFILPVSEFRPGMTKIGDWAFCYAPGGEPGPGSSRGEFDRALEDISGLRFGDFISAFSGSPDYYGDASAFGRSAPDPLLPHDESRIDAYTGFGQWQRFIFSDSPGICVPPGSVMVEHGDIECRFSSCSSTPLSFFQKTGGLAADPRPSLAPLLPKESPDIMNTDFRREDAVHGDEKKIAAKLAAAASRTGRGGLVEFYSGCPTLVLAGDAAALCDKTAREQGVEILLEKSNSFDDETPDKVRARSAFVSRKLLAIRRVKPSADVNLIHFGSPREAALSALLASRGLSTAPLQEDFYAEIASARLQVLSSADPVLTAAFDKLGLKWEAPAAPYGLAGTRSWLGTLFGALGRRPPREGFGPSKKETADHAALAGRLAGFAAGFISSPEELGALEGSWSVSQLPMVSFLAEAGLAIRLFAYAPDPAAKALAKKEAGLLSKRTGTRPRLVCFDSPASLSKALSHDRALRLVYSDIPLDPRLTAAGKNVFSAGLCEPGYEGALETLRRLLQLCTWDFHERYFRR